MRYSWFNILFLSLFLHAQTTDTLWVERFDSYASQTGIDGTGNLGDYPNGVTKWTLDVSQCVLSSSNDYFRIVSDVFRGRGLDGTAIWMSQWIHCAAYSDISFQLTLIDNGNFESADSIMVTYQLDAQSEVLVAKQIGDFDSVSPLQVSQSGLTGDSLRLKVYVANNAIAEHHEFDDIIVTGTPDLNAWINEFHYDNSGTDVNEGVEVIIQHSSSYDLSKYQIYLYNGSDGSVLDSETLNNFTEGETVDGFTFYTWSTTMQNGPDGMVLCFKTSPLADQFISYEGSFTATDGPASGQTSTSISVEESGTTSTDESLQLVGSGTQYSDFTWDGPLAATFGSPNNDGSSDQSLPVTLTSFTGTVKQGQVHLTWITESEVDNLGFLIHRTNNETGKTDLVADYRNDSRLQGQGNSSSQTVYTWADPFVSPGNTYRYILSDVDQTGTVTAHPDKSVTVSLPEMDSLLLPSLGFEIRSIAPNPFNPETAIEFVVSENLNQEPYTVTIVSLSGRMVQSITGNTHSGRNVVIWEGLDFHHQPVSSGIYLLSIQIGHVKQYRKLTVLK